MLSPSDAGADEWVATKGDIALSAENPIELLGLSAIHDEIKPERHEPYWWKIGPEGGREAVEDRLLKEAIAAQEARIDELRRLREDTPDTWLTSLRLVLENSGSADDAAAQLGVPTTELRRLLKDPLLANDPKNSECR